MVSNVILICGQRHVVSDCITCGVIYTVPERVWDEQRQEGGCHHCPNGHSQGWSKEQSETERLRRERDRLKQSVAYKDDQITALERSNAAQRGQVTKLKNRARAGVCPCCSRHFTNLERHMKTKHPEFAEKEKKGKAA